jgi:TRAP-type C4-dicarboxylate transport system permease large subunit
VKTPPSGWINVLAAVVGGAFAGFGIGRLLARELVPGVVALSVGVLLLWWAFADRRKIERGTPESERDGSHTVE